VASQPVISKCTYCKICPNQCGVIIDIAGDQIVKVRGDFSHPLSKGYTCPKGRAMGRAHHHPDAIIQPLMRKDGELVAVGWDECLVEEVAATGVVTRPLEFPARWVDDHIADYPAMGKGAAQR
jgi:anaerobic selenocysteine-containing dehydrogenase